MCNARILLRGAVDDLAGGKLQARGFIIAHPIDG
jgi:hypothetical protein